jgi:hypothetical protein
MYTPDLDKMIATTYINNYSVSWEPNGIRLVIELIVYGDLYHRLQTISNTSQGTQLCGITNEVQPIVDRGGTLIIQLSGDSASPTMSVVPPRTARYISLYNKIDLHNEVLLWLRSESLVNLDVNGLDYIVLLHLWEDELNYYKDTLLLICEDIVSSSTYIGWYTKRVQYKVPLYPSNHFTLRVDVEVDCSLDEPIVTAKLELVTGNNDYDSLTLGTVSLALPLTLTSIGEAIQPLLLELSLNLQTLTLLN